MLRLFASKVVRNRVQVSAPAVMRLAKGFSTGDQKPEYIVGGEVPKDHVIVADVVDSLEWTLSSPPPLHQFEEVRDFVVHKARVKEYISMDGNEGLVVVFLLYFDIFVRYVK